VNDAIQEVLVDRFGARNCDFGCATNGCGLSCGWNRSRWTTMPPLFQSKLLGRTLEPLFVADVTKVKQLQYWR
jgi:hypothetical protein